MPTYGTTEWKDVTQAKQKTYDTRQLSHPAEVSSGIRSHQRVSDASDHSRQPWQRLLNATVEGGATGKHSVSLGSMRMVEALERTSGTNLRSIQEAVALEDGGFNISLH